MPSTCPMWSNPLFSPISTPISWARNSVSCGCGRGLRVRVLVSMTAALEPSQLHVPVYEHQEMCSLTWQEGSKHPRIRLWISPGRRYLEGLDPEDSRAPIQALKVLWRCRSCKRLSNECVCMHGCERDTGGARGSPLTDLMTKPHVPGASHLCLCLHQWQGYICVLGVCMSRKQPLGELKPRGGNRTDHAWSLLLEGCLAFLCTYMYYH